MKYSDASSPSLLEAINPILTRTQTLQALDYTQKSSVIELKIWIVRHQNTVSYLQVTKAVLGQRDTYTHIPSEQPLMQSTPKVVTLSEIYSYKSPIYHTRVTKIGRAHV